MDSLRFSSSRVELWVFFALPLGIDTLLTDLSARHLQLPSRSAVVQTHRMTDTWKTTQKPLSPVYRKFTQEWVIMRRNMQLPSSTTWRTAAEWLRQTQHFFGSPSHAPSELLLSRLWRTNLEAGHRRFNGSSNKETAWRSEALDFVKGTALLCYRSFCTSYNVDTIQGRRWILSILHGQDTDQLKLGTGV